VTSLLSAQMSRIIHSAAANLDLGPNWHQTAADTIEQIPAIRGLYAEHDTLNVLRVRHVQRPMVDGSTWSECAGCRLPWPCPDALALGTGGTEHGRMSA